MRDLRDPESVGKILLGLARHQKVPVLTAADELTAYEIAKYDGNPSCIDKYGRPDEVKPMFAEVQIR